MSTLSQHLKELRELWVNSLFPPSLFILYSCFHSKTNLREAYSPETRKWQVV